MSYSRPKAQDSQLEQQSYRSPHEFVYKGQVGDVTRVRFMSFSKDHKAEIACRKVPILKSKVTPGEDPTMITVVHDLGPEVCAELTNFQGIPLTGFDQSTIWRFPVFVFWKKDTSKGGEKININKLMYIECTYQLYKSIADLKTSVQGMEQTLAFNADTGRPDYEVDIQVIQGSGKYPNYRAVARLLENGAVVNTVGKDTDEVLAPFMDDINASWAEVQQAIHARETVEDVKRRIGRSAAVDISEKPEFGAEVEADGSVANVEVVQTEAEVQVETAEKSKKATKPKVDKEAAADANVTYDF